MTVKPAFGVCLTQHCPEQDGMTNAVREEIAIYFLSHKLTLTQQKWPVIKKKAYATVMLHYYLDRLEFVIKMDYKSLQFLFKAKWKNKKIQNGF